jgi:hypothetical protein
LLADEETATSQAFGEILMWKDEIVEEIRDVRDKYAARFDYDLDAIYKDTKEQEKKQSTQNRLVAAEEINSRGAAIESGHS